MTKKGHDMVHLHVHSDNSQLDGCGKITDYVNKAKELGHKALAFTEHGTMRGFYNQFEACKKADIKPIYGIEAYVADDMHRKGLTDEEKNDAAGNLVGGARKAAIKETEDREGIRKRYHLTLIAKNKKGMENLFQLSSNGWLEGFYYKPRIDINELIKYKEGIIVTTGCAGSVINNRIVNGQERKAREEFDRLSSEFGEDLWLEVMPHKLDEQTVANMFALDLYGEYNGKHRLVATQDAHYVDPTDWEAHEVLLCIGTADFIDNPGRLKFGDGDLYLKSRQEMFDSFMSNHKYMGNKNINVALDNTLALASEISDNIVEVDRFKCLMPNIDIPSKYSGNEYAFMVDMCIKGWTWREIPKRAEKYAIKRGFTYEQAISIYKARLKKEITALKKQNFVSYMLLIRDMYDWMRQKDIMLGPGRGSASGSIISFLLGITSIDPVEHNLLFERFVNSARIDLPDIDCDVEDVRRQEVIEYLRQKYGEDRTSQIATIGKLSGKSVVKDVSRVCRVPFEEANAITSSIIERNSGDSRAFKTVEDSFKEFEACKKFNKKYPDVLKHSMILEGMSKTLGIHAAGVITSPVKLSKIVPLEIRKYNGNDVVVTAVDMNGAQAMGLLKLDVLGLRTLGILKDALKAIKERTGETIDLERVDIDDQKVLKAFTDHEYTGIFQYDSPGSDQICKGIIFESLSDISVMTSLNRPGPSQSGLSKQYIERKINPELRSEHPIHPAVTKVCSDTFGVIVYQEHVQQVFIDIAGFDPSKADSLRKKIAKSKGIESLLEVRDDFIKGAEETLGMDNVTSGKIIDAIANFGRYGFNRSHSCSYSFLAFWGMWLKVYYPLEFYNALLKFETKREKIQNIAKDAKRHGINLLPPDVSLSKKTFAIDVENNAIRGSLVDIKSVGSAAADSIIANQPYKGIIDFIRRVNRRNVHKGVVLALAKSGALDSLIPNKKAFIENIEVWWKRINEKKHGLNWLEEQIEATKDESDYDEDDRQLIAAKVNPLAFGKHPLDAYKDFIKRHVKVELHEISEENFWDSLDRRYIYMPCIIVEAKYNQIGDYHSGEPPTELERKRMFWGARYANLNVEDSGGSQGRMKFDICIFDEMKELIDSSVGTPIVAFCVPTKFNERLKALFAVDLELLRGKLKRKEQLTVWEKIVIGKHPAITYPWKATKNKTVEQIIPIKTKNRRFWNGKSDIFTGVVVEVRERYDKNDNLMAFITMLAADNRVVDFIVFSSTWNKRVADVVKIGNLLSIELERKKDRQNREKNQYFFSGGAIRLYKVI